MSETLTTGEQRDLDAILNKDAALRSLLGNRSPASNPAALLSYLIDLKNTIGNLNNDVSFVATLLVKAFLRERFGVSFDAAEKRQGAAGVDVACTTPDGARIIGEIKTTKPYQPNFGAAQKREIRKDLLRLASSDARHRFMFVTDADTYRTLCGNALASLVPGVEIVNLVTGDCFVCSTPAKRRTAKDRFLGCLLGGAVGDALGAPVEFMKRSEILSTFGPEGIAHLAPAYGRIGAITDDTQMTLFTAEGLLRGWVRGRFKGITTYPGLVAHAYLRWLRTQGDINRAGIEFESNEPGWLEGHRELHARRSPGNTCLAALRAMASLGDPAANGTKGCGGVMRMAPAGLFSWRLNQPVGETFRLGKELAALTHGQPTGALAAGFLAALVHGLLDEMPLREALAAATDCLRQERHHEETSKAVERSEKLAASPAPSNSAIRELGAGWVAEEALAISIYCALVAKDFRHGVVLAVNHDGDSDSTGSITGNLLGVIHGIGAIPGEWLQSLELRSVITELSEDLYSFPEWNVGEHSPDHDLNERIWRKYPGF